MKDNVQEYIYIQKEKEISKRFIFKNPDTLQKARQLALRFYSQKSRHFTLRFCHDF